MNERNPKNAFLHGTPLSEKQKAEIAKRRESNPEFDTEELSPLSEESAPPITEQREPSAPMPTAEKEMDRKPFLGQNDKKAIVIPSDAEVKARNEQHYTNKKKMEMMNQVKNTRAHR